MNLPEELLMRIVAGKLRRRNDAVFAGKVDLRFLQGRYVGAPVAIAAANHGDHPDLLRKTTRRGNLAVAHSSRVEKMSPHIWWSVHYVVISVMLIGRLHRTRKVKHRGEYFEIREELLPSGVLLQDCFYRNSEMDQAILASRRYFP